MARKNYSFHHIIALCWLYFSSIHCQEANQAESKLIIGSDVETISTGWPIQDNEDKLNSLKTKFFYQSGENTTQLDNGLSTEFINQVKNKSNTFKLSLKVWIYIQVLNQDPALGITTTGELSIYTRNIKDEYRNYYYGEWMPLEFFFSNQDLEKFHFLSSLLYKTNLIAYKDIKFDYEVIKTTPSVIQPYDSYTDTIKGWRKYINPPKDEGNPSYEFMYFLNDSSFAPEVTFSSFSFDYKLVENDTITDWKIDFKYYIKRQTTDDTETKITVSGTGVNTNTQPIYIENKWSSFTATFKDLNSLKTAKILITTKKDKKFSDLTLVAIRNLEVNVTVKNQDVTTDHTVHCKKTSCFNANAKLMWDHYRSYIEDGDAYYIPVSNNNSLTIVNDLTLNNGANNDAHYALEYIDKVGSIITINHTTFGDTESNTILKIKSKPYVIATDPFNKDTSFSLSDLVAINSKISFITFSVNQQNDKGIYDSFLLKVIPTPQSTVFTNYKQNFLQQWNVDNTQSESGKNSWKDEWITIPNTAIFTKHDEDVVFNVNTESRIPASAQLISKWIRYDKALIHPYPRYRVKVDTKKTFNAFTLRPKVCDSLLRCDDVIILNKTDVDSDQLHREYVFKFSEIKTDYIKLVFSIEYFVPPTEPIATTQPRDPVNFKLRLMHFGDPCDGPDQCPYGGICYANPEEDPPNVLKCDCNGSYLHDCSGIDYCQYHTTTTLSGKNRCTDTGCDHLGDGFQCQCLGQKVNSRKIFATNWESTEELCFPVKDSHLKSKSKNWNLLTENTNTYFPKASDNQLELKFEQISENVDIRVILQYDNSEENKNLTLIYSKNDSTDSAVLFDIRLTTGKDSIEINLIDFLYTYAGNFSLFIQIKSFTSDWHSDNFTLTHTISAKKREQIKPISYGHNWLFDNDKPKTEWRVKLPNHGFDSSLVSSSLTDPKSLINFKFEHNAKGKATSIFMSEWMYGSTLFTNSFNTFSVKFKKISASVSAKQYVPNIRRKLYTIENNKLIVSSAEVISLQSSKDVGDYIAYENNRIPINVANNSVFKVSLEFEYYLPDTEIASLDIIFYAFSVGDSCYTDNRAVCSEEKGPCIIEGPQQFYCDCKNKSLTGQLCEQIDQCKQKYNDDIKNEDYCNQLPSMPDTLTNGKRCHSISQTFRCDCPNYGYTWDNNKCKRIAYEKVTVGCDGNACDPFASMKNELKFSNKNLPDIPKEDTNLLPFYYLKPDKSLTLSINKLNVSANDACFELNYYSTSNAKIDINYNAANVLSLASSTGIKNGTEYTDWKPIVGTKTEKFCAKTFASDGSANFNVSLVSKYANTDNDIVAIKLKAFDSDKYVEFPGQMTYTVSAPFITYLSHLENNTHVQAYENQWPVRVPNDNWKQTRQPLNGINGYDNFTDTITFTDELTAATKSAYLLSKWIAKYTDGSVLSFYVTDVVNPERFTIRAILVDKDYNEQSNTLITLDSKSKITRISLPVKSISTAYRLKFKVDYQSNNASQKTVSFALVNIALGDPCVIADINEYNLCSGHGHCNRIEDNKKSVCVCEKQNEDVWSGERCSMKNYCNMTIPSAANLLEYNDGNHFCESKKYGTCINVEKERNFINFQCSCQKDVTYWNIEDRSCSPIPKCLSHTCPDPVSQDCKEPDLTKNETVRCNCKDSYVAVADGADDKALKCERFDPCIVLHQNISETRKGNTIPQDYIPCGTPLASCIPIETIPFNANIKRDYYCVCPANFETKNERTNTECDPLFCDLPLNQCKQNCEKLQEPPYYNCTCFNNEVYNIEGNDCKRKENKTCDCKGTGFCVNSNNDCQCRVGYYYDTSSNDCVFQQSTTSNKLCKNGTLIATDGVLKCACNEGFELNKNLTCDFVSPCATNECDKSAVCVIDKRDIHKYKCQCPEGTMFDNGLTLEKTNQTCLPLCSAQERNKRCREKNAKCNPFKVYSNATIRNHPENLADYCDCRTGYVNFDPTDGCRLGQFSVAFRFQIKNTFDNGVNKTIAPEQTYFASHRQKRETTQSEYDYDIKDRLVISVSLKQQEESLNRSNADNRGALDQQAFIDGLKAKIDAILIHTGFAVTDDVSVDRCTPTSNNEYIDCTFVVVTDKENKNKNLADLFAKDCQVVGQNCFFHEIGPDGITLVIHNDSLAAADLGKLFEPCSLQQRAISCPYYTTCLPSQDGDSYYSCTCNADYFNVSHTDYIKTQHSVDERKFPIEQCLVNNKQCEKCPSRKRSDNQNGKCVQEAPVLDPTDHLWKSEMKYCGCEEGFWKENNQSTQCSAACPLNCGSNGQCVPKASVGYCLCNDGWSGENCGDEHKASVGGWIAGIVVLAVLVVVVAIVALIFARRSRGGDTSSAHAMDEYSHTSYRVGQQSSATARSQPSAPIVHTSSGRDNKGFSRD